MASKWDRLVARFLGTTEADSPPISTRTASILLVLYTLLFVIPFYLSPKTRPSRTGLSRDHPTVIKARITSVCLTCVVCSLSTLLILTSTGNKSYGEALHQMGWYPPGLFPTAQALFLTMTLFAGPLYESLVVDGQFYHYWMTPTPLQQPLRDLQSWTHFRNIIAGPITEEILFRSTSIPLMLLSRASTPQIIFLTPLIFGLAHLHHLYEFRLTNPHVPFPQALFRSLFQLGFTSLFGAYEVFLFLRTGSLLAICLVHGFCNCMGLPRVWGRVPEEQLQVQRYRRVGNDNEEEREVVRTVYVVMGRVTTEKPSVLWTVAYYVLLVGGAVMFWLKLGSWTESDNSLLYVNI